MRTKIVLGLLALAMALGTTSPASAETKKTTVGLIELGMASAVAPTVFNIETAMPVLEQHSILGSTALPLETRATSDIVTSPEVLEVAFGRWQSSPATSFNVEFLKRTEPIGADQNLYGGRNVPVLKRESVEAKTYRTSVSMKLSYLEKRGGVKRPSPIKKAVAIRICPLSRGVAPQFG